MPTALEQQCAVILTAASTADMGLVVRTNDPVKARASLYHTRKLLGDTALSTLQIRVSPNDSEHEIWVLRMGVVTPLAADAVIAEPKDLL